MLSSPHQIGTGETDMATDTSKTQHTAGPWTTRLFDSQIIVYGPNKIQVLSTSWHGSIRASYPLKAEAIANATLAAAAPELLWALKNMVECFGSEDGCNQDIWIEQARAALSKAGA